MIMIFVWGGLTGVLASLARPYSFCIVGIAAVFGAIGGYMQCHAIAMAKDKFIHAASMMEIRKIIMGTRWGKYYIYFLWFWFFILLALSVIVGGRKAPMLCFSGYFAQMFVREVVTLKTTIKLSRNNN